MNAPAPTCPRCAGAGWVWLTADGVRGPRAAEASCPECCGPPPQAVANWREAHHWSPQPRACGHCGAPTHLHDDHGAPAHKVCAERGTALPTAPAGAGSSR